MQTHMPCYWDFITIWSERYVIPQCWRWWFLQQFYTESSQPFKPIVFRNSSCCCPCLLKVCWWDMQLQRNKKSMHNIIMHLDPCIVNSSKMVKPFNPLYSHFLLLFAIAHTLQNVGPLFYLFEELTHNRFCKAHLEKKYFIHTSGTNWP